MAKADYSWTIAADEMAFHRRLLGRGGYGEVHEVSPPQECNLADAHKIYNIRTGQAFARKIMRTFGELTRTDIENEFHVLVSLCEEERHVNIVNVLKQGQLVPDSLFYIDMELCEFNLDDFISRTSPADRIVNMDPLESSPKLVHKVDTKSGPRDLNTIWTIMADIAAGLAYIHRKNCIHRDLNPRNVLYCGRDEHWKIGDFGTATLSSSGGHSGTLGYRPPELLRDKAVWTIRADIWALGCIFFELALGRKPFNGDWDVMDYARNKIKIPEPDSNLPEACQKHVFESVKECLAIDFNDRPIALQVRNLFAAYRRLMQRGIAEVVFAEPISLPSYSQWKCIVQDPLFLELACNQTKEAYTKGENARGKWEKMVCDHLLDVAGSHSIQDSALREQRGIDEMVMRTWSEAVVRYRAGLSNQEHQIFMDHQSPEMVRDLLKHGWNRGKGGASAVTRVLEIFEAISSSLGFRDDVHPLTRHTLTEKQMMRPVQALSGALRVFREASRNNGANYELIGRQFIAVQAYLSRINLTSEHRQFSAELQQVLLRILVSLLEVCGEVTKASKESYFVRKILNLFKFQRPEPRGAVRLLEKLLDETCTPLPMCDTRIPAALNSTSAASRIFDVPYPRNRSFVGREVLLENLRIKLDYDDSSAYSHRVALYGLGGIGKTQTALEYCFKNVERYDYVFWISGKDRDSVLEGYRRIARLTECTPLGNLQQISDAVWQWLHNQERWLMVIDNLDDFTVADCMPLGQSQGHVLVTTRNPHSDQIYAHGCEVPVLTPDESAQLLSNLSQNHSFETSNDVVQHIVRDLGFYPLAIEQAAPKLDVPRISGFYQTDRKSLLSMDSSLTAADSWQNIPTARLLSLQSLGESSIHLLELFAFLHSDEIRLDYLQDGKNGLSGELRNVFEDDILLLDNLMALESCSLVKLSPSRDVIMIHHLVSIFVRERPETRRLDIINAVVESALEGFPNTDNLQLCRKYRNQALLALNYLDDYFSSLEHVRSPVSLHRICQYLHDDGYSQTACVLLTRLFEAQKRTLPPEDRDLERTMHLLAIVLSALGRHAPAVEMQKRVLDTRKIVLGAEHPETLVSMHHLAVAYTHIGRSVEAVRLFKDILDIQTKGPRCGHDELPVSKEGAAVLRSKEGMAIATSRLGLAQGVVWLRQIMETRQSVLGMEHRETLSSMHNLAMAYVNVNRFVEAAELQEIVVSVRRRILGFEHPETLRSMQNLALIYRRMGREQEAVEMLGKTVTLMARIGETQADTEWCNMPVAGLQSDENITFAEVNFAGLFQYL